MNVVGENYLVTIGEAEHVGKLYNANIYKVIKTEFHPFQVSYQRCLNFFQTTHPISPDAQTFITALNTYFADGHYFSYGYDLTASRQKRLEFLQSLQTSTNDNPFEQEGGSAQKPSSVDPMLMIACDPRYFWNLPLYRDFMD